MRYQRSNPGQDPNTPSVLVSLTPAFVVDWQSSASFSWGCHFWVAVGSSLSWACLLFGAFFWGLSCFCSHWRLLDPHFPGFLSWPPAGIDPTESTRGLLQGRSEAFLFVSLGHWGCLSSSWASFLSPVSHRLTPVSPRQPLPLLDDITFPHISLSKRGKSWPRGGYL